jgi:hypothetical protein
LAGLLKTPTDQESLEVAGLTVGRRRWWR